MKKIKITVIAVMTDEYFDLKMEKLKSEINSGVFPKELIEGSKGGITEVEAEFIDLNY